MTRLRSRLERLTARRAPRGEVWVCDLTSTGDGLCRLVGSDAEALTPEQLEALPLDRARRVIEVVDAPEPEGEA